MSALKIREKNPTGWYPPVPVTALNQDSFPIVPLCAFPNEGQAMDTARKVGGYIIMSHANTAGDLQPMMLTACSAFVNAIGVTNAPAVNAYYGHHVDLGVFLAPNLNRSPIFDAARATQVIYTHRRYRALRDSTEPPLAAIPQPTLDTSIEVALKSYEKLSEKNWDGYGADSISAGTIAYARKLLTVMPTIFGVPDISPGGDGTIALEWHPVTGSVRKFFFDIGPGEEWSAYWKRRTGEFERMPGTGFNEHTKLTLEKLFAHLSV